jgi:hypothetical protein
MGTKSALNSNQEEINVQVSQSKELRMIDKIYRGIIISGLHILSWIFLYELALILYMHGYAL